MRQFLDRMDKPRVDDIRGIPPAIAIEQSNPVKTSRSTVGTMTEINDYLKLLWPRIAHAFCPSCSREIRPETAQSIAEQVFCHFERSREIPLRNRSGISQVPRLRCAPLGMTKTEQRRPFSSRSGFPSPRERSRGNSSISSSSRATCAFGSTTKSCASTTRIQKLNDSARVCRSCRIASPSPAKIVRRLVEAIETALRFGKGKINVIQISENAERSTPNVERPNRSPACPP